MTFEPRQGGRVYETWQDGTEADWGEVLTWEPPERFVMTWNMTSVATEVELRFAVLGPALTRVSVEHRGWERLIFFAAHQARWREFADRGELLMIGPFARAQEDGAMAVFTTREAAEEFVRGDPFVLNGVIRKWTIRDWNEALVPTSRISSPTVQPPADLS